MNQKIIIVRLEHNILTCVKEQDVVVDLFIDESAEGRHNFQLGDLYIGRVKRIVSNIGAAFIEIAPGVECYYDLSEAGNAFFTKKLSKKSLSQDEELLVQITQEALKTKRMSVTSNISITGEYAVITSGDCRFGVSRKIIADERKRLQAILKSYETSHLVDNYGIILRTNARGQSEEEICKDIETQMLELLHIKQYAPTRVCYSKLNQSSPPYVKHLSNIYKNTEVEVVTDDTEIYEVLSKTPQIQENVKIQLRFYEDHLLSLRKLHNLDRILERCISERVWLKSGGYLIIQATEALTVIDVNTGGFEKKKDTEQTKLQVNLEAALEISMQLRLRNLSGIIIVDFINMMSKEHEQLLTKTLEAYLTHDPIRTTVLGFTRLKLMEITRKKTRRPITDYLTQKRDLYEKIN